MSKYDTLNEEQKAAVIHTEGPLLLLAGAGSGKTRVLTHRIAYMIEEQGINPWNILAITFTNKAAGEMRERVNDIVGFGAEQIWVATFHATCVRILRRHIELIGYDNNFTIYDTDDQKTVIKEVCKKLNIDTKQIKERAILSAISTAKDELITPEEYRLNVMGDYGKEKLANVYKEYQTTLKKSNALDFDDIIVKTIELFKLRPDVLENYHNRFHYIMVDEYQDTNTAQFELIRLLALSKRNLCVVGDDDQSIYKFRGANISNILDFEKVYSDARVIKLEQNYRSTKTILNAANAVIQNNLERKDKALWTSKEEGNRIHFRPFENAYEEATYIVHDIKRRIREDGKLYKDCAILYRTNAQSRILEEHFVRENIPYDLVGGTNFYSRREIKDILAYLKTIDNGKDDVAIKRIINVPKRGIGATTLTKIQEYADENNITFFEALLRASEITSLGRSFVKLEPFIQMIQVFRSKMEYYSLEELVKDVIDAISYEKYLEEMYEEDAQDRIENVNELISKVVSFEEAKEENNEKASLSVFLEEVALVADIDRIDEDDNRVLMMTIHAAKGLEFSCVYLAGMEDGIFPSYMTIVDDDKSAMEEERRLAYVAITRAKDDLTILSAKMRMIRGETQYNAVSRFVKEIPFEFLDNKPPSSRKDREMYGEDSIQRSSFKSKPFQGMGSSGADFFQNNPRKQMSAVSFVEDGVGKTNINRLQNKPKATIRPKATPLDCKPFIAGGLSEMNGITKGAQINSTIDYKVGDRVKHLKYAEGVVKEIVKAPRDYQVTVEFDKVGVKVMYAAFAKLKKI